MSVEMAFGAMKAMRAHGLVPGKDISIIGIDNHDLSELLDLSTVAQPVLDLGRIAVPDVDTATYDLAGIEITRTP